MKRENLVKRLGKRFLPYFLAGALAFSTLFNYRCADESDNYPGVANNPPVITSAPIKEVNESEFYEYQVMAVDLDNDTLTYSLPVAPDWLSINPGAGLITGTAPEIDEDAYFNVSIVVSDRKNLDTQSYVLTVKYVPEPFLSQTVNLVDYVYAEYNANLSDLESAVLEIYYKELGSTNYSTEPIKTKEINTSSYTEIFDFYEIHGVTKGDYRFVIKAPDFNLSDIDEIVVPDYIPKVDLNSIPDSEKDFNEEGLKEINLPVPTDKNPEDNPVAYTFAISLDSKTSSSLDPEGNLLTLAGNRDKTGNYQIELEFGDPEGEKGSATLEGYIYNLPDISGFLEDNEEDIGEQGVIRVYYPDPYNSSNYLPLEIDKINDGEGNIINAGLGKIQTSSDGIFSFQINKKASDLNVIVLQVRIGTSENYTGYVRTISLFGDDNQSVLVRAVPYAPYEDDPQIFRQFMTELVGDRPNTRFDFDGEWLGGINEEFENYTGLIGIEILSENPFGAEYGTFTPEQQDNIKNKILDSNDINGIIGNYSISDEQIFIVNGSEGHFYSYEYHIDPKVRVVADPGWIIVVPYSNMPYSGLAEPRKAGTLVYGGTIYLRLTGNQVISHEFGHIFIGTSHPLVLVDQSVMSKGTILQITGIADKKAGKLIYEQTYMIFPPALFPQVDNLYNIFGLEFYGENQGTGGTLSEYYFELEEDFTEEQQDFIYFISI